MNNILKIASIRKSFSGNNVLEDISLECCYGDVIGISGKNGTGKSTFLKILCNLVEQDKGTVEYQGNKLINKKNITLINNNDRSFFWRLSVFNNLDYFLNANISDKQERKEQIENYLKLFNIEQLKDLKLNQLSSGQKTKVSLIRGLAKGANIILFDEVTSHLDHDSKLFLFEYIKTLPNKIIFWVSHNEEELDLLCTKIIYFQDNTHVK